MKVRNINGTSENTCKCGSWLNHWVKFGGGALPDYCSEIGCPRRAEVGAHVQKANSSDMAWYIIPLCKGHNELTGQDLEILESTKLVSANVNQTCGT